MIFWYYQDWTDADDLSTIIFKEISTYTLYNVSTSTKKLLRKYKEKKLSKVIIGTKYQVYRYTTWPHAPFQKSISAIFLLNSHILKLNLYKYRVWKNLYCRFLSPVLNFPRILPPRLQQTIKTKTAVKIFRTR